MNSDEPYYAYIKRIYCKSREDLRTLSWRRPGKYELQNSGIGTDRFQPVPYPGCTILALPYPCNMLSQLDKFRDKLTDACDMFAPVPVVTLHMTIADLIAGENYNNLSCEQKAQLLAQSKELVAQWDPWPPVVVSICGLSAFSGVIIALVGFQSSEGYKCLVGLRNAIYTQIQDFGVIPKFPFVGHITLGYVESETIPADLLKMINCIRSEIHADYFEVTAAGVFTFTSMSEYSEYLTA